MLRQRWLIEDAELADPLELIPVETILDPTSVEPDGAKLHFVSGAVAPQGEGTRQSLTDWRLMEGVLLAVGFQDGDTIKIEGSAVMVAPGVALTARHVFDQWWDVINRKGIAPFLIAGCSWGHQLWSITNINKVQATDLALLTLVPASELPPGRKFHQATISARPPVVGEPVLVAGFRAGAPSFRIENAVARLNIQPLGAVGRVKAVHINQRDSVVLPFPVVEIDCSAVGGMSGGPVFDQAGHLIGIISLSMETDDDLGPTYASLAFLALGWRIPTSWPPGLLPSSIALIEIDPRLCPIHDRDRIDITFDDDSNSFSLALNIAR